MTIDASSIIITPQILTMIAEIDAFNGAWKASKNLSVERLKSLKKVATIESVGSSNRIEGNKLTNKEIDALFDRVETRSFSSRDEQEVAGYAKLMETIFDHYEVIVFSENYIKQFHQILLSFTDKDEYHRGSYKKFDNFVCAYDQNGREIGVIFETASPFDTPRETSELIEWTRLQLNDGFLHPLLVIGLFVVWFLAIHPFQDGNGRLSRILTTLLLLKSGYLYVPYSSIEAIIENNKEGYYKVLRQTQGTFKNKPDYTEWLTFFLRTLQKQKRHLEAKIDYSHFSLSPLSDKIISLFDENDRLTTREIAKFLEANLHTVKKHIQKLVKMKLLTKYGSTRGSWYMRV
ncbi:MAG: Fic family protein [Helicobacteraceae bacterium]|nr:Fic family protein [Helicobacteraceae bacterium]